MRFIVVPSLDFAFSIKASESLEPLAFRFYYDKRDELWITSSGYGMTRADIYRDSLIHPHLHGRTFVRTPQSELYEMVYPDQQLMRNIFSFTAFLRQNLRREQS